MKITRVQAEALATLATKLRPDWRHPGVLAAISKCDPATDPFDLARALINLAADPSVQTPGLLHGPGPHWLKPDGTKPARRDDHAVRCPSHPHQIEPCLTCRDDADLIPPPPYVLAAKDDAVAKGQAVRPHAPRVPLRPAAAKKETR